MASFDLATEPWIPVRYSPGLDGPSEIGLVELFARAHEIADIALPVPPAASGLWRILYLVAARLAGLDDLDLMEDWSPWKRERRKVLESGRFNQAAIDRYFAAYQDRFDLFSPDRPWLQDPRLAVECAKSTGINKLAVGRSAGNNQVWLSHHTDINPQPVRAADAAWYLISWLYYGPSGKVTARTVGSQTASNVTAGPLRSRISFHPLADNLSVSLIAGIPYLGQGSGPGSPDRAPWEEDGLPDPLCLPPSREGLSGVLTGQFRHALLLKPSADGSQVTDAWITWAWRMPSPDIRDPYLIYETPRKGKAPYARYARFDRAIWRDLDALLDTGSGRTRRPAVFDRLPDETVTGTMRVRAYGFHQDGQVRDQQWFTASTPPVLAAHDAGDGDESVYEDAPMIAVAREAAERVGDDLRTALRRAWLSLGDPSGKERLRAKDPDPPWLAIAVGRYWKDAGNAFWQMVTHERSFEYPSNTFIGIALKAYDQVTDTYVVSHPGVVVRALERARSGIYSSCPQSSPLTRRHQMPDVNYVPQKADALVRQVTRLTMKNPADRSMLRHSLGKLPEDVAPGVHRIVVPFLPPQDRREASGYTAAERAYYTVAALIASQPRSSRGDEASAELSDTSPEEDTSQDTPPEPREQLRHNLGYSLAYAANQGGNAESLEGHLQLLARQDADGLYRHLPRLILRLRNDQAHIDWGVLIRDLTRWSDSPRLVAKEWAQSYYRTVRG